MTSRSDEQNETREDVEKWILDKFGVETWDMIQRFIDDPEPHPYELAADIQKAIRGTKNQHDLLKRETI